MEELYLTGAVRGAALPFQAHVRCRLGAALADPEVATREEAYWAAKADRNPSPGSAKADSASGGGGAPDCPQLPTGTI